MSPSSGRTKSASLPCRPLKRALPFRGQSLVPWRFPRPPLFPSPRRCLLGTCNVPSSARGAGTQLWTEQAQSQRPGAFTSRTKPGGCGTPEEGPCRREHCGGQTWERAGALPGAGGWERVGKGWSQAQEAGPLRPRAVLRDRGTRHETRPELPKEHEGAARGTLRSPECSGLHAMGTEKGLKTAPAAPAGRPQPPLPAPIPRAHPGTQTLRLPWPDRSFQSAGRWNPGPGLLCLALG